MSIEKFSADVTEQLGRYVYRLVDPRNGNTFYVGKGTGNRVFAHVKDAAALAGKEDGEEDAVSLKISIINEIKAAGLEVIHIIHRHGIADDETAFEVESALIDAYPGLATGSGHGADRGPMHVLEIEQTFHAPLITSFPDKCVIIKVRLNTVVEKGGSVYEAARYCWRIGPKREEAKYAPGVVNGVVRGVYQNMTWRPVPDTGRYEFTADDADDAAKERYLNRRIPEEYRKPGQASPFLFTW
jgi:hypothetical protein